MAKPPLQDAFHDAVAFARAVGNKDWDAAQIVWDMQQPSKLTIAMPLATIVNSLVTRIHEDFGVDREDIWASIVEAVDEMEVEEDGEDSEEGEQ